MSPHEGEQALSLLFGLLPAIFAVAVLLYLLWRIVPERIERAKIIRQRPDPHGFKDDPALQERIDRLFILRHELVEAMDAKDHSAREQDLVYRRVGQAIAYAVERAHKSLGKDRQAKRDFEDAAGAIMRLRGRVEGAQRLSVEEVEELLEGFPPKDAAVMQP